MSQINVRAIIEKDGKYLMVRHHGNDFFCLAGGRVEPNEELQVALVRELQEELGVEAQVGNLQIVHRIKWGGEEYLPTSFIFHVKNVKDFARIDLAKTSHGQQEIAEVKFVDTENEFILPRELKVILPKLQSADFAGACEVLEGVGE